jgi:hypothetical protein
MLDRVSYERYDWYSMISKTIIKLPVGFCKELRRICPHDTKQDAPDAKSSLDVACGINRNYFLCSKFEKRGEFSAVEETYSDGSRRVYFATTQDIESHNTKDWAQCDSASCQKLLSDRIGEQKITRPGKSQIR